MTEEGVKHQQDIIAATFAYLDLISKKGINEAHFSSLKARAEKEFNEKQQADLLTLSNYLAEAARNYPFENLLYAPYEMKALNKKVILNTLATMQPENMTIWLIAPEANVDQAVADYEGLYKVTPILQSDIKSWKKPTSKWQFTLPEAVRLEDKNNQKLTQKLTAPTQVVNQEGAQAWLMHSQYFTDQKGLFYLVFNNNFGEQNAKNFILSCLLKDLLLEKTQTLLQRHQRMGVNSFIERTPYSAPFIQLSGDTDKQPELLAQLISELVNLTFTEKQVVRARANLKEWVTNWDKAPPVPQMVGLFREYIEIPARNSQSILPHIDSVKIEDLQAYHKALLHESYLLGFAFGY